MWDEYSATRPYLANTHSAEAGRVLLSNRETIVKDTVKRADTLKGAGIPLDEKGLDEAIRVLASILNYGAEVDGYYNNMGVASKGAADVEGVFAMTSFWMRGRGCVCREIWGRCLQKQLKACLHFDSNASHAKA